MVKFIEQRGTGKTYRLLRIAEMNEGIFACINPNNMKLYAESFEDIDASKIQFASYSQLLNGTLNGSKKPIYIDEIEIFLRTVNSYIKGYNLGLGDFMWWEKDNENN